MVSRRIAICKVSTGIANMPMRSSHWCRKEGKNRWFAAWVVLASVLQKLQPTGVMAMLGNHICGLQVGSSCSTTVSATVQLMPPLVYKSVRTRQSLPRWLSACIRLLEDMSVLYNRVAGGAGHLLLTLPAGGLSTDAHTVNG
jgi:hypothetical protein